MKHIHLENRQTEYGSFFDDDFAKVAFSLADSVPLLDGVIFDLVADWRIASYAGALPASIPHSLKSFHDSYVSTETTPGGILSYSEVILARLSQKIPDLVDQPKLRSALLKELLAVTSEISQVRSSVVTELDGNELWQQYLAMDAFKLGLSGTMKLVYTAVYCAYESFLVRATSIALDGRRVRITDRDFKTDFKKAFGEKLMNSALLGNEIIIAKEIRNAFFHAGGRLTDKLKDRTLPLVVLDGYLNVSPQNVRDLYKRLKAPALEIMKSEAFKKLPN